MSGQGASLAHGGWQGKADLGDKRTCTSCAARFYDLHRDPAVCVKCGTPQARPVRAAPTSRRAGTAWTGRGRVVDRPPVADDAAEAIETVDADETEADEEDEDGVPGPIDADDADPAGEVDGVR